MVKQSGLALKTVCMLMILAISLTVLPGNRVLAAAADPQWDASYSALGGLHDLLAAADLAIRDIREQYLTLRKRNTELQKDIYARIKLIDKTKLERLYSEAEQAKRKYAPLLEEYARLSKQGTEARKQKNRKQALMADMKRNRIKGAVEAARTEIKKKQAAAAAAKQEAIAKSKSVKEAMTPIQPLRKKITSENKRIAELNKSRTAVNKRYKAAVKHGDAVGAALGMKTMVDQLQQILNSRKSILAWEREVQQALKKAETRLP